MRTALQDYSQIPRNSLKIQNDPTFTQLTTLQQYLQTIHKRNEIDSIHKDV